MKSGVILAVMLSACMTVPTAESPATAGGCDAAKVQDLIGKPAASSRGAAQRGSGARTMRVYETGSPVTMDYRMDRLNIETDDKGLIVRLSCG